MDYEQKYKDALERAKNIYGASENEDILHTLETLFPELKESEDEKVRKHIIEVIKNHFSGEDADKCIAWLKKLKVFAEHGDGLYYFANSEFTYVDNLSCDNVSFLEKQGTSYTKRDVDDAYVEGMAFAKDELVEQKSAWSEEDDSMFQSCIGAVATNDYYKGEEKEQIYDWLKSIKQRIGG